MFFFVFLFFYLLKSLHEYPCFGFYKMACINGGPFKRKKIGRYPGDYSQIYQIHLVLSLHLGNTKTENKGTVHGITIYITVKEIYVRFIMVH